MTESRSRQVAVGTVLAATLALSACGTVSVSGRSGPSSPGRASASSAGGSSGSSSSSSGALTDDSSAPSQSASTSGSDAASVTGERSKASIAVPAGWKVFTRSDLKNPSKLNELSKLTGSPVSTLKAAVASGAADDLLVGPHIHGPGGGAENISMGTTSIPNSEGIPDEPSARAKSQQEGLTFVKFSYVNTSAGRAAAIETTSNDPGKLKITQIDFYVPGPADTVDEILVTAGDSKTANSLLQGIEKSVSIAH